VELPSLLGGSLDGSATRVIKSNIWIGPKLRVSDPLCRQIHAMHAEDQGIQAKLATERAVQCGISPNFCGGRPGSDTGYGYSCCQVGTQRGMTNNETCQDLLGVWEQRDEPTVPSRPTWCCGRAALGPHQPASC
jgi:hypothetical protein